MKKKKRILILNSGSLPVPATLGGAVETGIEQLINVNEKEQALDLYILSVYEPRAYQIASKYKHTRYFTVKYSQIDIIHQLIKRVVNKLCSIFRWRIRFNINDRYINEAIKIINKQGIEYVVVKNTSSFLNIINTKTHCKIIFQLHNDFLNNKSYLARFNSDIADLILVNSNYIKGRVLTISDKLESKIKVNKNCITVSEYQNLDKNMLEDFAEKYNIDLSKRIILYSGRLHPSKGCYEMLLALNNIKKRSDWHCIIAGGKWFSDNKENNYIKKLKAVANIMGGRITFLGYVPHSDIAVLNSIADIVVVPSIWEEPAGRVVLEAQAGGAVPIVSDAGGISDYMTSETGIIVNRGDLFVDNLSKALVELLDNNIKYQMMSKKGKEFAVKFNEKRYYNELIDFLNLMDR